MHAKPVHVALYLTKLMDSGCSTGVIQAAVYGIKWAHKIQGATDPTNNNYVINLIEASKRQNSAPVVKKDIVSTEQIITLCENYSASQGLLVLRDLCIIVLCFEGFLRFNEVSSLKCKEIAFHQTYISIQVSKSKTDQYRQGNELVISQGSTPACPIAILRRYIDVGKIDLSSDHFLFKPASNVKGKCASINKNKKLSYTRARETVVARLKEICGNINIGMHSSRAGGASMAARASVNERCWKRHGRWKSDTAEDGYVKDTIQNRLEVTRQLNL